jgi:hypothetical protein
MPIPKIIHQLWVGPKPAPIKLMNTWKEKHPDFEYILWNESEFAKRGITFRTAAKMELTNEICGKVDMMRWELLYRYGGVFIDADSICIEPLDDVFMNKTAFATYENENVRKDLVANGNMGFPPGHPLCGDIIEWILSDESTELIRGFKAWYSVGPSLLTKFLNTGKYSDFSVFPSHCFLPIHFTGNRYTGHKKVYAHQLWGSANNNYETMNEETVPVELVEPREWISILIPIYNTPQLYLRECFDSIKLQNGYFGMELVVINDGSDQEHTQILETELEHFKKNTRFTKVIYDKRDKNMGIGYSLHHGVLKCTNELVFRMDGDDIMLPERMKMQIAFMKQNQESVICGTGIQPFKLNSLLEPKSKVFFNEYKIHPIEYTWDEFLKEHVDWMINHPTVCFRKSAILSVGNYRTDLPHTEDYDLILRVLKKYKKIHSLPNVLLFYRLHTKQATYSFKCDIKYTENLILKKTILDRVLSE